jgi:hypothetical protein
VLGEAPLSYVPGNAGWDAFGPGDLRLYRSKSEARARGVRDQQDSKALSALFQIYSPAEYYEFVADAQNKNRTTEEVGSASRPHTLSVAPTN